MHKSVSSYILYGEKDPKGSCNYSCFDIIYFELRFIFTEVLVLQRCFYRINQYGRGERFYDGELPPPTCGCISSYV